MEVFPYAKKKLTNPLLSREVTTLHCDIFSSCYHQRKNYKFGLSVLPGSCVKGAHYHTGVSTTADRLEATGVPSIQIHCLNKY